MDVREGNKSAIHECHDNCGPSKISSIVIRSRGARNQKPPIGTDRSSTWAGGIYGRAEWT